MGIDFLQWSESHRQRFESSLHSLFSDSSKISEACRYPLNTGGKRIRPLLLFAAYESLSKETNQTAINAALAIELIHTYSLVHDDLPCMDDDDFRRGKPTVHKAYDIPSALLVGDALLTEAFSILSSVEPDCLPPMLRTLSQASGHQGMIGGQSMDIGFEGAIKSEEQLNSLHNKKTGALITAAVLMGGIAGKANGEQLGILKKYGKAVGLAFQLADDILDEEEDAEADGPPSYVKLLGREKTTNKAKELSLEAISQANRLPNPEALIALAQYTISRKI